MAREINVIIIRILKIALFIFFEDKSLVDEVNVTLINSANNNKISPLKEKKNLMTHWIRVLSNEQNQIPTHSLGILQISLKNHGNF